jgi:hypothetical protein
MGKSAGIIGGVAGGIGGAFLGGPQGAMMGYQLGSGLGSAIGGQDTAGQVGGAYGNAAGQQAAYGQQAQQGAMFRPVGMTTAFGSSNFGYDPYGNLTSAGYTLTPEMQAIRNRAIQAAGAYNPELIGQMAQPLGAASQDLFGLGGQYIAQSPEEAAQRYMTQQQGLLAPGRAADFAKLSAANYGRGTGGLGVNTGTGGAPSNPLAQALFNAQERQNAEIAARAEQEGRAQTLFGADLYTRGAGLLGQVPTLTSAGYAPLTTQLGLAQSVEGMGQQALDLSSALAARQSTAGAQAGNLLLRGGLESAQTGLAGNIAQAGINASQQTALQNTLGSVFSNPSLGNWFGGLIGSGSTGGSYGSMGSAPGLGGSMGTGLLSGGGGFGVVGGGYGGGFGLR